MESPGPAKPTLTSGTSFQSAADQGLALALNLFLFALPLAYITAVREILLGAAVFFWLAAMVIQRRVLIGRTPLDLPLAGLVAVAVLSLVWAVNPAYTFKEIRGELLKGLLVFYLAVYAGRSAERLQPTWLVLLIGNLLLVLYAFWDFGQSGGDWSDYYIRARSLHSGYGSFGTYLVTVLPYLLVLMVFPLGKWARVGLAVLLAGNFVGLYITFGRAMWLAAGLEVVLLGWLLNQRKVLLVLLVVGGIAILALPRTVWFHGERLPVGAGGAVPAVGGTAGDLVDIWKLAVRHIQDNPFQGIGFGRHSFSEAFTDFRRQHQPLLWHAHNTLLNITFQTGIQGLLVLLWVLGVLVKQTLRPPPQTGVSLNELFILATGVMVIGFFVRNFFDDFFVDDNALLFWFLTGTAFGVRAAGTREGAIPPKY